VVDVDGAMGPHNITLALNHLVDGGAARVASYLSCAWAAMGRNVTILTSDDGQKPSLYPLHPKVLHRPLGLQGVSRNAVEAIWRNGSRLLRLRRAIVDSHPDLLVSFLDGNNVMCLLSTRGMRHIPTIISERTDPHGRSIGFAWEHLRRLTYPWADCLVTQSSHAMSYFSHRVQAKGIVLPNPVLLPEGANATDPEVQPTHRTVMTMGRLNKVKGHDMLIDAFARIVKDFPDWDLWIYGDGSEREALVSQIHALNLDGRIFLPGNTTQVGAKLREADLFVLPSRVEGFPNALAEAMACGLPVISFDCASGPSELIRDGLDGLLVPPSDIEALSKTMSRLMGNPEERRRLAFRASEVLDRFSLERILGLWETVIQRISANNQPQHI